MPQFSHALDLLIGKEHAGNPHAPRALIRFPSLSGNFGSLDNRVSVHPLQGVGTISIKGKNVAVDADIGEGGRFNLRSYGGVGFGEPFQ